MATDVDGFFPL